MVREEEQTEHDERERKVGEVHTNKRQKKGEEGGTK